MTRRQAFRTFAGAAATTGIAGAAAEAKRPPNFVLVLCDDMGYADIEPYRKEVNYTPELARMAREGMKFTSWYAAPVCSPSRAALMTGCYPRRVGLSAGSWHAVLMPGDWHGLNPAEVTVAEVLKTRGYATAIIGKWHLGDQPEFLPTKQGFDYWYGLPYSNDMRPSPKPLGAMTNPHPPLPLMRNEKVIAEVTDQDFLTGSYTEEAIAFLRRNKDNPFFLYLPHSMVHAPLAAGKSWRGKTGQELYADSVAEVDWSTGQILRELEKLGLEKNTLVIFLSDNGGTPRAVNTPLRGFKGSTWEGGIRVPAIAWWPGTIPAGKSSDAMVSNMDILPTFAELAGARLPGVKIDGQSLAFTLRSGSGKGYDTFWYWHSNELRGVRQGPWKLHISGELYNLTDDIGEARNVAAANPDVVARLNKLLDAGRAELGDKETQGPGCRPVGKAKGPLRFQIPRHSESGYPPQAPVKTVPGAPYS